MATAAPKAELADDNDTANKAAAQRTHADQLASLAQSEKHNRQNQASPTTTAPAPGSLST